MRYRVTMSYTSSITRDKALGHLGAGMFLDLDAATADALNRDCPGLLVEVKPEPEPVKIVKVAAPAAPTHRAAPVSPRAKAD